MGKTCIYAFRIIIGNKDFKNSFNETINNIVFNLVKVTNLSQEILSIRNKIINHFEENLLRKSEGAMIDIEFLSQYLLLKNIDSLKNSNFEIPLSVDFILLKLLDKHVDHFD